MMRKGNFLSGRKKTRSPSQSFGQGTCQKCRLLYTFDRMKKDFLQLEHRNNVLLYSVWIVEVLWCQSTALGFQCFVGRPVLRQNLTFWIFTKGILTTQCLPYPTLSYTWTRTHTHTINPHLNPTPTPHHRRVERSNLTRSSFLSTNRIQGTMFKHDPVLSATNQDTHCGPYIRLSFHTEQSLKGSTKDLKKW